MSECDSPESKLAEALAECERLREENRLLRGRLKLTTRESTTELPAEPALAGWVSAKSSPEEKVALFRSLFRGREDVHAVRWEGRNGKAGYSPASRRVWGGSNPPDSDSPREYLPLTDQVLHDHLTGRITAGVYPLLTDETCWFLAADFDKATWQEDVRAYLDTCSEWHVPALLVKGSERKRGQGMLLGFGGTEADILPGSMIRKSFPDPVPVLPSGGEGNERGGGHGDGVLDQFLGVVAADLGNMLGHEHRDVWGDLLQQQGGGLG